MGLFSSDEDEWCAPDNSRREEILEGGSTNRGFETSPKIKFEKVEMKSSFQEISINAPLANLRNLADMESPRTPPTKPPPPPYTNKKRVVWFDEKTK